MESSIKISLIEDENGMHPVLNVKVTGSDDPRDQMMKSFFQKLGGNSSWLRVVFDDSDSNTKYLTIHPVAEADLLSLPKEAASRMEVKI